MSKLNYWDANLPAWMPCGPLPDHDESGVFVEYIPSTGGVITGPLTLRVDAGAAADHIVANGGVVAAGFVTTPAGTFNMSIAMTEGRTVNCGFSELRGVAPSEAGDALVSSASALAAADVWDAVDVSPSGVWAAGAAEPAARLDRDGMVLLSGSVKATTVVSPATVPMFVLPDGWRPARPVTVTAFTTLHVPCLLRVGIDGEVVYLNGPVLNPGTAVSLDSVSFYLI